MFVLPVCFTGATLRCYKCNFIEFKTDNTVLKWIAGQLSQLSDPSCRMENGPGDVPKQTCETSSLLTSKCMNVNGTLRAEFLGKQFSNL